MILSILISFLFSGANASPPQGKSIINQGSDSFLVETPKQNQVTQQQKSKPNKTRASIDNESNLPPEYNRKLSQFSVGDKALFVSRNVSNLKGLQTGTIVRATIDQELIISQNVPNPVRAIVTTGDYKGSYILGEAVFDKDLKRALISFHHLLTQGSKNSYLLKAQALSLKGSVGLEGEYFNQSAKFVIAEFTSAAVAGYLDSGISRSQTIQGNYVTEPSASNAAKAGAVAALSKSTDRFAEAARSTSDFVKTEANTEIQIVITETPHLDQ